MSLGSWMSSLFTPTTASTATDSSTTTQAPSSPSHRTSHAHAPASISSAAGSGYAPPLADGAELEALRRSKRMRVEEKVGFDDEDYDHSARKPYLHVGYTLDVFFDRVTG